MDGINRVAFTIFGLDIYWYAVLITIGMVLGVVAAGYLAWKRGFDKWLMIDLMIVLLPLAIVGARLYYVIFDWNDSYTFAKIFQIREGGLAIYGGVIAGAITALVFCKVKKFNLKQVLSLLDCLVVGLILGQAIGRWGNFFNQEAHGKEILNQALHFFPMGVLIKGNWYFATFFYEFVVNILGFGLLFFLNKKWKHSKGFITCGYFVWYGAGRAIIEGWRTDSLYIFKEWLGETVRVSQVLSILMVVGGVIGIMLLHKKGYFHAPLTSSIENEETSATTNEQRAQEENEAFLVESIVSIQKVEKNEKDFKDIVTKKETNLEDEQNKEEETNLEDEQNKEEEKLD